MKAGSPVYVKAESTLADGLAVPKVGVNAFATAAPLVDKVRLHLGHFKHFTLKHFVMCVYEAFISLLVQV